MQGTWNVPRKQFDQQSSLHQYLLLFSEHEPEFLVSHACSQSSGQLDYSKEKNLTAGNYALELLLYFCMQ